MRQYTGLTDKQWKEIEKNEEKKKEMRIEVRKFACAMEGKLKETDHKGGWDNVSIEWLFLRLQDEVDELREQLVYTPGTVDYNQIRKEAVDVANFAMMIFDKVNR